MPKAAIRLGLFSGSDEPVSLPPEAGDISIHCYPNEVPSFVGPELESLYDNLYSSLAQFTINGTLDAASTYLARRGGRIVALFLFRQERHRVRVLNEIIHVDGEEIERFAEYLFAGRPEVSVISFHGIDTGTRKWRRPVQRFNCLEDIVLTLPGTEAEYQGRLGKTTRRNMKRYLSRMERDFPSFQYELCAGSTLDEADIRSIIDFNKARMANKRQVSNFDEREAAQIVARVKACGRVGIIRIEGCICAGAISYRVGDNYFLGVLAHDPAFDPYRPGLLCCYLTICQAIRDGGREFHFLWGRYEFKYLLLGVQRDLDALTVYRSRAHQLLHWKAVIGNLSSDYGRRFRLWLQELRHRNGRVARMLLNPARQLQGFLKGRGYFSKR